AGDRVTAVRVQSGDRTERFPVGELLSTGPLTDLVRWLRPGMSGELAAACERLRFRALTFVNMPLSRADFSPNTWMYVASKGISISRIQEPKRRSPFMAPPGRTSLMLEVPCDVGDPTWRATAPELRARMLGELRALGLPADDAGDAHPV